MDAEGIVRIASSLHESAAPPSPDRLRRSLETLLGSSAPRRRLIVVLSGAPEEIAALEALPRSDRAAVAVVAPGNAGEAIPLVEARLRDLEDHAGSVARDGRDVARPLALAALLALVVEALLSRTSFGAGA
jgi:hypothetical protein